MALESACTVDQLRDFAAPIEMPPGSSVYIDGQRGIISAESTSRHRIIVNLDAGGSIHPQASEVVPWDAWLDVSMPPVDQDLLDAMAPSPDADRMLHATLRGVRNSHSSATELGNTYHAGRAEAGSEKMKSPIPLKPRVGGA